MTSSLEEQPQASHFGSPYGNTARLLLNPEPPSLPASWARFGARVPGPALTVETVSGHILAVHAALERTTRGVVSAVAVPDRTPCGHGCRVLTPAAAAPGTLGLVMARCEARRPLSVTVSRYYQRCRAAYGRPTQGYVHQPSKQRIREAAAPRRGRTCCSLANDATLTIMRWRTSPASACSGWLCL